MINPNKDVFFYHIDSDCIIRRYFIDHVVDRHGAYVKLYVKEEDLPPDRKTPWFKNNENIFATEEEAKAEYVRRGLPLISFYSDNFDCKKVLEDKKKEPKTRKFNWKYILCFLAGELFIACAVVAGIVFDII